MKSSRGCYFSLAFSIGSIGMAWGTIMSFSPSDRISVQRGALLTTLGFVYFISLTNFLNKFLLETSNGLKIRKKYRLRFPDVLEITNRLVSAVQAVFSSIAGCIVCRYSCAISFLHTSHFLTEAYGWFAAAYFLYDMWSMYTVHAATTAQKIVDNIKYVTGSNNKTIDSNNEAKISNGLYEKHNKLNGKFIENNQENDKQQVNEPEEVPMLTSVFGFVKYILSNPLMTIHHVYIGTYGLFVIASLRGGIGDCIFSWIYIMEISTPFVSLRSVLSRMKLKSTKIYITNGLLMIVFFFIFRVLLLPYLMYSYSVFANISVVQAFTSLPLACKISICVLFLPQYYWFYIMTTGAFKVFFQNKKPDTAKTDNQKSKSSSSSLLQSNINENSNNKNNNTTDKNIDSKIEQSRSLL